MGWEEAIEMRIEKQYVGRGEHSRGEEKRGTSWKKERGEKR